MRHGHVIGVARHADAAGIDHQDAGDGGDAGHMGMPAQDHPRAPDAHQSRRDGGDLVEHGDTVGDVLQQVLQVAARRAAVAGEHAAPGQRQGLRQGCEPGAVGDGQERGGEPVRLARGIRQHRAVVVAAQGPAVQRHLGVGGSGQVEGAGHGVAEVDHQVGRGGLQVGQDGLEGNQVAVNVGDDGDTHGDGWLSG